jgi:hypothetical protein
MRSRTEDLLSLRDAEPLDAQRRAALGDTAKTAADVERLRQMRRALGELPQLEAPAHVWQNVVAALEPPARRPSRLLRTLASAAIAASVAAAALYVAAPLRNGGHDAAPSTIVASDGTVAVPPSAGPVVPASYVALVEESARLERMLASIPYQRPLMKASTAGTIAGLEDRIAFIDQQLAYSSARRAPIEQRQLLWTERVELMNALVHVRYAQAQPGF